MDKAGEPSAASVRLGKAQLQVGPGRDGRVSVRAAAAGDEGAVVRVHEEGQRLACAAVSSRGQQHPVKLSGKRNK